VILSLRWERFEPGDPEAGGFAVALGLLTVLAGELLPAGLLAVVVMRLIATVYDLSATPLFLRGSGYAEGTLFPLDVQRVLADGRHRGVGQDEAVLARLLGQRVDGAQGRGRHQRLALLADAHLCAGASARAGPASAFMRRPGPG
jgi:hypothetical protein